MRQRTLGILGGTLLVVGAALAVVSGIVGHSTANGNASPPASASAGDQRPEPGRPSLQPGAGPGSFGGGPRGPDLPGGDNQP